MMDGLGDKSLGAAPWLAGLAAVVSGYKGYQQQAERAETDQKLRAEIVRRLSEVKLELQRRREMAKDGPQRPVMHSAVVEIEELQDSLTHESQGISSLLDSAEVEEPDIDALYAYDRRILEGLDEIQQLLHGRDRQLPDGWQERIDQLKQAIDERRHFINRSSV